MVPVEAKRASRVSWLRVGGVSMIIKSYRSLISLIWLAKKPCLRWSLIPTSKAIKSCPPGTTEKPSLPLSTKLFMGTSSNRLVYKVGCWFLATPQAEVALPCESRSINKTFLLVLARAALRFTAVVVFPTPPF